MKFDLFEVLKQKHIFSASVFISYDFWYVNFNIMLCRIMLADSNVEDEKVLFKDHIQK